MKMFVSLKSSTVEGFDLFVIFEFGLQFEISARLRKKKHKIHGTGILLKNKNKTVHGSVNIPNRHHGSYFSENSRLESQRNHPFLKRKPILHPPSFWGFQVPLVLGKFKIPVTICYILPIHEGLVFIVQLVGTR